MFPFSCQRVSRPPVFLSLWFAVMMSMSATAAPTFRSIDNRLPNPDRPYDMTSGTINFPSPPFFGLYDLQFQPRYPQQLDIPKPNMQGNWQFDSFFDITYQAMVSTGLEPVHQVTGHGTAHAVGITPGGTNPQVFDTELVALNLVGLSHYPEFLFRESSTLLSSGVTTREDLCPLCLGPFTHWSISSFFDVFAEVSFDGGATWTPGDMAIHIEQPAEPTKVPDFNSDGMVDAADFVKFRKGSGTTYPPSDYELWKAQFGATISGSGGQAMAPEPPTCGLLTLLFFGSLLCPRHLPGPLRSSVGANRVAMTIRERPSRRGRAVAVLDEL